MDTMRRTKPSDNSVHVMPTGGRQPHRIDHACWCGPHQDLRDPRVWIHKYREVA